MNLRQFFTLIFAAITFMVSAQNESGMIIGVNGGVNYSFVINQMNYGQKEMEYNKVSLRPAFGLHFGYDFNGSDILSLGVGMQKGGQFYKDSYGSGAELEKNIDLQYLAVPLTYMHVFGGKNKPSSGTKLFAVLGGQFNLLQKAEVTHKINGADATLYDFAVYKTDGSFTNANTAVLATLTGTDGKLDDDKELFNDSDIQAFAGLGVQSYFSENFFLTVDFRVGYSLTDLNKDAWHLDGFSDGKIQPYDSSNNAYGALRLGLSYKF